MKNSTRPNRVPASKNKPTTTTSGELGARAQWCHEQLVASDDRLHWLERHRGITLATVKECGMGWEPRSKRYTFPIHAVDGHVVNVRSYRPGADASKVLHATGHGSPVRLYAPTGLNNCDRVLFVEGESDAVLAAQELEAIDGDVLVVTGTGGASTPPSAAELEPLRGCQVFICYDCDQPGLDGARKLQAALHTVAADVYVVDLDLDRGEDITDWFMTHGNSADELIDLLDDAEQETSAESDPATGRRSLDELVALAVDKASGASRNDLGLWLACQLRDERYSQDEARPCMLRFADSVTDLKPEPYTHAEANDSLASAYSRPARHAIGTTGAGYLYDDIGNGQRLVDKHGADMRFVKGRGWFWWDSRRWLLDEVGKVASWAKGIARDMHREANALTDEKKGEALHKHAKASSAAGRIGAAIKMAESEPGITTPAESFDRDERLIAFRNGVVELTGDGAVFREHRREDYGTLMCSVAYDPTAQAPTWEKFLRDALPDDEVRQYLQRLVGYSLLGANPERRFVVIIGPGGVGKTTFGETIRLVLGEYAGPFNLSIFRGNKQESPRPDLLLAMQRRFIFTSEVDSEWELHGDQIKRMVGHDAITARPLYSNTFVSRLPAFTPWISTNSPPRVAKPDLALLSRIVAIPFGRTARSRAAQDLGLAGKLAKESAGIVAWAVAGWDAYCKQGLENVPDAVAKATLLLGRSLSDVDEWLSECTQAGVFRTPFADLWSSYLMWCSQAEIPSGEKLSKPRFGRALSDRGYQPVMMRAGPRSNDRKVRYRKGLRLRGSA